ncbi:hypothetical protein POTOM_011480 [Populus tomentosa]|uniref:SUEL-type lectin domain-containing protein n=1 Tax=Populus tomentosa TaxID=118781 RepID=A0A8X8D8W7_POPTO|nr:hypothetical protein POTOM_011480 [Populus tomentosa]
MALKKTSMCNSSNALLVLLFLVSSLACSVTASVSYDSKAITINGQRRILISGSIHYPRSSPEVFSQMHFMLFVLLLLLKLFLQMSTPKCSPGLCPLINTCNGFYCDYFSPNKAYKPKMWTEAWTGWFTQFGGPVPHRPAEDMAFSVARFIQKGGSFINYYMVSCFGNLNLICIINMVSINLKYCHSFAFAGLLRQPKWGHLKDLHRAIKLCEPALVSGDATVIPLGNYQEAHVFNYKAGGCAAFLANYHQRSFAKVSFRNMHYNLPPWSISILPDCKNTVYNTARVGAQSARMKMTPVPMHGGFSWQAYNEEPSASGDNTFTMDDFVVVFILVLIFLLFFPCSLDISSVHIDPSEGFLRSGKYPVLSVLSAGHALHVFINGQLSGTAYGSLDFPKLTFTQGVKLRAGVNKISLLSIAVGLPNVGPHFETWNAGILGPVTLNGLNEGRRDLSWQKWSYKIGLHGEALGLHSISGSSSVEWAEGSLVAQRQPLSWYKVSILNFNQKNIDNKLKSRKNVLLGVALNYHPPSGTCGDCSYIGTYNEKKCSTNCGEASQRWYHVPQSWLKPTGNLLVVFEEWGGDPNGISLVRRDVDSVCADIYEWQPTLMNYQMQASGKVNKPLRPKAHLSCGPGQKIRSIKFASFGTPEGVCGSYRQGSCHAFHSYDAFNNTLTRTLLLQLCVGQNSCSVTVAPEMFGGDPCLNVMKKLAVEAICS